jgi:septum site-determining protein MinC
MVLGLSAIESSVIAPDFAFLTAFMRALGIPTVGVLGGSPHQREAAVRAGLGLFPESPERPALQQTSAADSLINSMPQLQPELPGFEMKVETAETESVISSNSDAHPPSDETLTKPLHRSTLVIDKPVRTGQRIYADGTDLVVLSIVNAGAELIADGDIHVYAPLRGRAIAGAHGNQGARIFVQRLEAELISIAGCFQVFENGVPENVNGKPAQIHLDGSRLIFQPLAG